MDVKVGCAHIVYNEKIFKGGVTYKNITVMGANTTTLLCNENIYTPLHLGNEIFIFENIPVNAHTNCSLMLVCGESVFNYKLTFVAITPDFQVRRAFFEPFLTLDIKFCVPLEGNYSLQLNVYGSSRELTIIGPGCIERNITFDQIVPQDISNSIVIPLQVVISKVQEPIIKFTKSIAVVNRLPYALLTQQALFTGVNTICVKIANPSHFPLKNANVDLMIPYGNVTHFHADYVKPLSGEVLCKKVFVSIPSMVSQNSEQSNATGTFTYSAPIIGTFSYFINGIYIIKKLSQDVTLITTSWPSVAMVATEPIVPTEGGVRRLVVYITNPSSLTFYSVKVVAVPRNGTLVGALTTPVSIIPQLQPASTIPVTFIYKLNGCTNDTLNFDILVEAHLPTASKVATLPISLPARCGHISNLRLKNLYDNIGEYSDTSSRAETHLSLIIILTILVIVAIVLLIYVILKLKKV